MRAKHYCADCDFHFRATPEQHADTYHGGGMFRGITNGNWRDYEFRKSHNGSDWTQ